MLPRDAVLARYELWACLCLSVRPFVTSLYCIKTAKRIVTLTALFHSPWTSFLAPKILVKLEGAQCRWGRLKSTICLLLPVCLFISVCFFYLP